MAYSSILKPSSHMNPKTFTGNGGTQSITGVGFKPDWTWLKKRNGTANHHVVDIVRGVGYYLYPNLTNAQGGNGSALLTSFNTDGFTLDAGADSNASGATGISWNWLAGGSQGSSNTDGSINTTYTSVNTTSGFSINQYTGTGSNATVGHGLGVAPDMMIIKKYSAAGNQWTIYHKSMGPTKHILFTVGSQTTQANYWNNTAPTSSVWSMGNQSEVNGSGATHICYAFSGKQGYSKFGSYKGNGNADGAFVYTGFKPAFVMVKIVSDNDNWIIADNKRVGQNPDNYLLVPNANNAEVTPERLDLLSNGFKARSTNSEVNTNGADYIYMAFAENPLVASNYNVATAR